MHLTSLKKIYQIARRAFVEIKDATNIAMHTLLFLCRFDQYHKKLWIDRELFKILDVLVKPSGENRKNSFDRYFAFFGIVESLCKCSASTIAWLIEQSTMEQIKDRLFPSQNMIAIMKSLF